MNQISVMTVAEFQQALHAQGVPLEHMACICPACGTVQSGADLVAAGAGATFDEVRPILGFSCVGRYTGAPRPRKEPDGQPCNWTLGGFLRLHRLLVRTPDGVTHPHFELATPEQAQAHMNRAALAHEPHQPTN